MVSTVLYLSQSSTQLTETAVCLNLTDIDMAGQRQPTHEWLDLKNFFTITAGKRYLKTLVTQKRETNIYTCTRLSAR